MCVEDVDDQGKKNDIHSQLCDGDSTSWGGHCEGLIRSTTKIAQRYLTDEDGKIDQSCYADVEELKEDTFVSNIPLSAARHYLLSVAELHCLR